MAVVKEYRAKGIGKQLLKTLIDNLKNDRFKRISLSVDKANFAHIFYKNYGFVNYLETQKSIIMTKELIEIK